MTDHTKASTLSPAAFAIVKAAHQADYASRPGIAAALCAAADQVEHHWDGAECVDHLQALAAELNGTDYSNVNA